MAEIQLNLWAVLLTFAMLHGLLLVGIVLSRGLRSPAATKFLGMLALVIVSLTAEHAISIAGLYSRWPHTLSLSLPLWYLIGPLLYVHFRQLTRGSSGGWRLWIMYLAPFFLVLLTQVPFILQPAVAKVNLLSSPQESGSNSFRRYWLLLLYSGQTISYTVAIFGCLRDHTTQFKDYSAGTELVHLEWLRRLFKVFLIYLAVDLAATAVLLWAGTYFSIFMYASVLALNLIIYAIGYTLLRQPMSLFPAEMAYASSEPEVLPTSLPPQVEQKKSALLELMETQKLYRNSELKAADIAEHLSMTKNQLSQLLNQGLGTSFYDFVNGYRLREASQRLTDPANNNLTILGIALDVGFNCSASFYRCFKREFGLTPSAFIKERQVQVANPKSN